MLLGQRVIVSTDHKNLTYTNTKHASDRILRQRLLLEEYGVDLVWIKGARNEAADTLSRNEFIYSPTMEVDTTESETMLLHEIHANDMQVPIDYLTIYTC